MDKLKGLKHTVNLNTRRCVCCDKKCVKDEKVYEIFNSKFKGWTFYRALCEQCMIHFIIYTTGNKYIKKKYIKNFIQFETALKV